MKTKLKYYIVFLLMLHGVSFAQAQFTVSVTSITNVTCNGGNDGAITVVVTNSTPSAVLTYTVSGTSINIDTTATTMTFTGLSAVNSGFVGVVDPIFGGKSANFTITSPKGALFTYPGSPYCKSASNPTPTINLTGGPYPGNMASAFTSSPAGLSINGSTGVIDLTASTAGTYTVTNTIPAAGSCPQIAVSKTVIVTSIPDATFSYTTPQCQSGTISPTLVGTAGAFSSTVGLNFVSNVTGQIDLSASTAGAYTVTNLIAAAGGCAATSQTAGITIVAPSTANFSYTGSPYCKNAANPIATIGVGSVAGTFSEISGNLVFISTSTGQVNLSSSVAGIYNIVNTLPAAAPCPIQTSNSSITITTLPVTAFSYSASTFCKSGTNPSPTLTVGSTSGGTYSSTVGLSLDASTGLITLLTSNVGTYTVTYTIAAAGGCSAVSSTFDVTITSSPVSTFSYTGTPYCSTGADPSPVFSGGGSAGTFTAAAGLVFVSAVTGQVDLSASTAGNYTVTNTIAATGGCPASVSTSSITIQTGTVGTFSYTGTPYCKTASNPSPTYSGGGIAGAFTSTGALTFVNAATGVVNLTTTPAGTYTVTNTIPLNGACPLATYTSSITVNAAPVATFSYAASPYCSNVANPSPTFSGGGVAGTFSVPGALNFISASTGQINLTTSTAGTYTVTNTVIVAGCANATATSSVTITAAPVATFSYAGTPYCNTAANPSPTLVGSAGTFTSSGGLNFILASTGQVNLATSTAGTYTVTNTIPATGGCPITTATSGITIAAPAVGTFSYTGTPYCKTASNPSPVFSGGGVAGTFSSTVGLTINAAGLVDIAASTAGTYTVTNTIAAAAPCAAVVNTSSITINPAPAATFSYTGTPYCKNAGNPSPVYSGGGTAGTFSSTAGLVFISTSTGQVDIAGSTAGTYTVTNTVTSAGCPDAVATSSITITTVPVATFSYTGTPYCSSGADPSPTFPLGSSAGTFTSTGGLNFISSATGQVDVSATTAATYTVTNTIVAAGGCAQTSATSTIQVVASPVATFSYTGTPYCKSAGNPSPVYSGGGVVGAYTATAGLVFANAGTGQVDLSLTPAGTYTVTNTVSGSAPCIATAATSNITITAVPIATFSYASASYCNSGADPSPTLGVGASLGTFTSAGGLSITPSTGVIDVSASTASAYTVTNTIAAAGGCASTFATTAVTIVASPIATFSYTGTPYCSNGVDPSPTLGVGASAGTFTAPGGLSMSGAGLVDLSASTAGTYTVTNTVTGTAPCINTIATSSITVTALPVATFSYTGTPYCKNLANPSPTLVGSAGTFSSTAGLNFVSTSVGSINLSTSTAGAYTVTNTIVAAGGCPQVTANSPIVLRDFPTATISGTTSMCVGGTTALSIAFTGTSPWDFSYSDGTTTTSVVGQNSTPYTFNVSPGSTKNYTVSAISNAQCAGTAIGTAIVTVNALPLGILSGSTSVCGGATANLSVNLTGTAPWSITYSDGISPTTITGILLSPYTLPVTPIATTIYSLTAVNDANCSGTPSGAATVTIITAPTATLSGGASICSGASTNLSVAFVGSPPYSIVYTDGVTPVSITNILLSPYSITVSPTATRSYTVSSVTDVNCTGTTSGSALVSVLAAPTATISGSNTICLGGSATVSVALTGAQPWSVTYFNGTTSTTVNNIATTPFTFNVSPAIGNTTYTVTAVSDVNCSGTFSGSALIAVQAVPTATLNSIATTICSGVSTNLSVAFTGTIPYSLTYTDGTPVTITGISTTPYLIPVSPASTKTYTITAVSNGTCAGTFSGSKIVTVNTLPTATVSGSAAICSGGSTVVSIALSGAQPWDFTYTDGTTPVVVTGRATSPYTFTASPATSKTYTVSSISDVNCTGTASGSAIVTVATPVTGSLSGTATICTGSSTNLSVVLAGAQPWSISYFDGTSTTTINNISSSPYTITKSPLANTTYTLTAVSTAACVGTPSGTATVTVLPALDPLCICATTATVTGSTSICAGASTTVSVALGSTSPWALTYTDGTTSTNVTGIIASPYTFNVSPASLTTYSVTSVSNATCSGSSSGSAVIAVNVKPTATISGTTTVCAGVSSNLSISFTGPAPYDIVYTDGVTPVSITGINSNPYTIAVSPLLTKTYSLTSVSNANCAGTVSGSAILTVNSKPTFTMSGSGGVCIGSSRNLVFTLTGIAPWNVSYNDGGVTTTINGIPTSPYNFAVSPISSKTYTPTAVSDANCTGSSFIGTALVTVNSLPTAVLSGGGSTICAGVTNNLTVTLVGTAPWSITYTNGITPVTINGIPSSPYTLPVIPLVTSTYSLTAVSDANCSGTSYTGTALVTVIPLPTSTLAGASSICPGASTNLSVALSGSTPWAITYFDGTTSTNITNIVAGPYLISKSPASNTNYSITSVTDNTVCVGTHSGTQTINVYTAVSATLSGTSTVCPGTRNLSVLLTGTAPWSLTYNDGSNHTINGIAASPYSLPVTAVATTSYSLVSVSDGNCSGNVSGGATLTVLSALDPLCICAGSATISGSTSICNGAATSLDVGFTGASPWAFTYNDGGAPTAITGVVSNPYSFSVSPTSNKTYVLNTMNDVNCSGSVSGSAVVNVNVIPTADISGAASICNGVSTDLTFNLTGNQPWDITYFDGTSSNLISGITSSPYLLTVTPSATTNYSLTSVVDVNCTGTVSGSAPVTVRPIPTATIIGGGSVCTGGSISHMVALTGSSPWSITWDDGTTNETISGLFTSPYTLSVAPSGSSTYTLTDVSDQYCLGTTSGSASVNMNTLPTLSSSGSGTICPGDSNNLNVFLGGVAPFSITYDDGTTTTVISNILTSPYSFYVKPLVTTTYTFTAVSDAHCSDIISTSEVMTVRGAADPVCACQASATLIGSGNLCSGGSTTLSLFTALGGTFPWDIIYTDGITPVTITGIVTNPYNFTVSPTVNTTYTLSYVKDANCVGSTSGSAAIAIVPAPTASISGTSTLCLGQSANLVLNLTGNPNWAITYVGNLTSTTITGITSSPYVLNVSPTITTNYSISNVSDVTCTGTTSGGATLTVNPLPTVTLNGAATICNGASTNLSFAFTGASPWNITYNDGTTTSNISGIVTNPYLVAVSPTTTKTYTVTAVSNSLCSGTPTGSVLITVNPLATATLSGASTICTGNSTTLNTSFTGVLPWSLTYTDGTTPVSITNIVTNPYSIPVSPTTTKSYSLTALSNTSCGVGTYSGTGNVTVLTALDPLCACATTATLTGNNTICNGSSANLNVAFTGAQPFAITYTDGITPVAITGIATNPYSLPVSPTVNKSYNISAVSNASCSGLGSGTASIIVNSLPTATISGNATLCNGGSTPLSFVLTGTQPWSITYTDGTTPVTINGIVLSPYSINVSPSSTKTFTLTSVSDVNCSGTSMLGAALITVNPLPSAVISGTTTICSGSSTNLNVAFTGNSPWSINYNDGSNHSITGITSNPYSIPFSPLATTTFTLSSVSDLNCTGNPSGSAVVSILAPSDPLCVCSAASVLTGATSICNGNSATLSVALSGNPNWSLTYFDGVATSSTITNITTTPYNFNVSPSSSKTYSITSISDNTCTGASSGTAAIVVNSIPTAAISGTTTICDGNATNLNFVLGGTGPWSIVYNNGTANTTISGILVSPYFVSVSPSTSKTYTLVSVLSGACTGTISGSAVVTVKAANDPLCSCAASANLWGGSNICEGASSNLFVSLMGTQPWSITYSDGTISNTINGITSTPYLITVSPVVDQTYSITNLSDVNCTGIGSGTALVSVNPLPTAILTGGGTVCNGSNANLSVALTGDQPWDFNYSDGTTTSPVNGIAISPYSFNVNPSTNTTYSLIDVTDGNCTGTISGTAPIIVKTLPSAVISGNATICTGVSTALSVVLNGTGPWTIVYNDGATNSTISNIVASPYSFSVSPTIDRTYSLISVNDVSCTGNASGSAIITVLPALDPLCVCNVTSVVSGLNQICAGNSSSFNIALTGVQPWNLTYSDGSASTTINGISASPYTVSVTPLASKTYTVSSVNNASCFGSSSGSGAVQVDVLPTATISGNTNICNGGTATLSVALTGNQPWTIIYNEGATPHTITNIATSSYTFNVNPASTSVYSLVSITDVNCTGTVFGSATVTINAAPTTSIGGTATICPGVNTNLDFVLTGAQPWNLTYSDGTTSFPITNIGSSPYSVTVNPASTTTYSATVISDANCSGLASGSVVITTKSALDPTCLCATQATIAGGGNICPASNSSLDFTMTGTQPWSIVYTDGTTPFTINNITTSPYNYSLSPLATQTYTVTSVTNAACTGSGSGSATIVKNVVPTATLSGTATICNGANTNLTFTLTGSQPWDLTYTDGTTPVTITGIATQPYIINVAPTVNTTYSVVSISDILCTGTFSGTPIVTVSNGATATLSGTASICPSGSTTLSVILAGVQPYSITYTDLSTPVTINGIATSPYTFNVSPLTTKVYSLTYVNDVANCNGNYAGSAAVTVRAPSDPICTCPAQVVVSGDANICDGTNTPITFTLSGNQPWSLTYTDGVTPVTVTGITTSPYVINVNPSSNKTYTATAITDASCTGTVSGSAAVQVSPIPTATLSGNANICNGGSSNLVVNFTGVSPWDITYTDGTTPVTITNISSNPYSISVSPTTTQVYSLVSVDGTGCSGTVSGGATVSVGVPPTAALSGTTTICSGVSTNLNAIFTGVQPYDITYTANGTPSTITGITANPYSFNVSPVTTTTYLLTNVTDAGCSGTYSGTGVITVKPALDPTCTCVAQATLTGGGSLCSGGANLNVSITGTAPWDLTYTDGTTPTTITGIAASPYSFTVSPASNTTYSVTSVTNATCTGSGSGTAAVVVSGTPTATITGNAALCGGSSTNLNVALSGLSPWTIIYTYGTTPKTISNILISPYLISVNPIATTTYSLTSVVDGNCSGTVSGTAVVSIQTKPTATISGATTVCAGTATNVSITLTGTAPWNIDYSNGTTTTSITGILSSPYSLPISPIATSTYTVTSVDDANCSGTTSGSALATVLLANDPLCLCAAKASISGGSSICAGDISPITFTLQGTQPWSVVYTDGTTPITINGITTSPYSINVTPASTKTYSVSSVSDVSCVGVGSGSAAVQVSPIPTATLSGNANICNGGSSNLVVNFTGVSPWDITYTDGTTPVTITNISSNPYSISVSPTTTQVYSLVSVDGTGCSGTVSGGATVSVGVPPTAALSGTTTICSGVSTNLNAIFTGVQPYAITYTANGTPSTITGIISNPYSFNVSPVATTTYLLTNVTDAGCSGTYSGTGVITVKPALDPTCTCVAQATLTGGGSLCSGGANLNVSITGTAPWDLTYTDGTTPTTITGIASSPYSFTVSPASNSTYSISSVTNATCTGSGSGTAAVVVSGTPTATITGNAALCGGASTNLNVALSGLSPWTIIYTDGTTPKTISNILVSPYLISVNPIATTTYSLTSVVDGNCSGTVSGTAVVSIQTKPTATISGATTVCAGTATNVSITLTGTAPWNIDYSNGTTTTSITGILSSPYSLPISPIATSTYTVTSVDDANCSGTTSGSALATVLLANDPLCLCAAKGTISGGSSICSGGTPQITFTLQGASPWNVKYTDGINDVTINGIASSPYQLTVAPVTTSTYSYVTLSDANCSGLGSGSTVVQVAPSPTATLAGLQTICLGDSATVSVALTGSSPWNFTYFNGTTSKTLTGITSNPYSFKVAPITSLSYTITAVSDANCTGTTSGSFDVNVSQPASATLSGTQTICSGKTTNIDVVFTGNQPYTLTYKEGVTPFTITNISSNPYKISVTPLSTTTYSLVSVSDASCTGTVGSGTAIVTVTPANDPKCTCLATATLTGGGSVCSGGGNTLNFALTDSSPWDLTYSDGTTSATILGITSSPYVINVNPISTSTYTVSTIKNATCTGSSVGAATVLVNSVPTATLNGKSTVCGGTASSIKVQFTGNQPWSVTYSDGAFNTTITGITVTPYTIPVSPLVTKIYSLVDVTDNSCSGTVSGFDTVLVSPSPTATLAGIDTICPGSNSSINIVLTGTAPWALTYTDGTTPVSITGILSSPYQIPITNPSATKNFTLTAVNDATCTGTFSGTASVFVYASGTPICNCSAKATLSGGATLCAGGTANLSVDLQGTKPWAFTYTDGTFPQTITGINSSTYSFTVQSLASKTFKISAVSDVSGCKGLGNGAAIVNVNPFPIASVSGTTSICTGGSAFITVNMLGTAPFNLKYIDGTQIVTVTGILASPYKIQVTPAVSQAYTVIEFSDAQCTGAAIGAAIVTVNTQATAKLSGGTTICNGATTNLNVIFTGNKPWSVTYTDGITPVSINNITSNPYSFNVKPSNTTKYKLVSSGDSTCVGIVSDSTIVTVLSGTDPMCICATTAKMSGTTAVCAGVGADLKIEFTGTSPWDFVYTDGVKNDTITGVSANPYTYNVKPLSTSTFTLKEIKNGTCTGNSRGSAAVIVNASPTAVITDTAVVCKTGQAANLTVNLTGEQPWTFVYSDGTIDKTLSGITPSSYQLNVSSLANKSYTLKSVSDKNCVGTYSGLGQVMLNPVHTLTYTGNTNICATNLLDNEYIIKGQLAGSNLLWKVTSGQIATDTSLVKDTVAINWDAALLPAKKFTVIEETNLGCKTDSLLVSIFYDNKGYFLNSVSDDINVDNQIFINWSSTGLTNLDTVSLYRRTVKPTVSAWTKLVTTASKITDSYTDANVLVNDNVYEYQLKGKGLNICSDSMNSDIHQNIKLLGLANSQTGNTTLNWNKYVGWGGVKEYQVWAKHTGDINYIKESTVLSTDSSVVMPSKSNELYVCYRVLAIENVGGTYDSSWSNQVCSSFNYDVSAVNAFSPGNGDGKGVNEYFYIKDIEKLKSNQVFVFNRWGNVVYSAKNYDNTLVKWDGDNLPEGTYFYIITSEGETIDKGTILLQR